MAISTRLHSQHTMRPRRGFTLTEIAIVLGIIGLILGAIWVAAAAVYNNMRVSKTTNQLLAISQAVRGMYATSGTVDPGADMTFVYPAAAGNQTYPAANIFPSDMVTGVAPAQIPVDLWQGGVFIQSQQNTVASDSFSVVFDMVPQGACIPLITGNTGTGRDSRLLGVSVGAAKADPIALAAKVSTSTIVGFPVAASVAAADCAAGGATDAIAFSFSVR